MIEDKERVVSPALSTIFSILHHYYIVTKGSDVSESEIEELTMELRKALSYDSQVYNTSQWNISAILYSQFEGFAKEVLEDASISKETIVRQETEDETKEEEIVYPQSTGRESVDPRWERVIRPQLVL